MTKLLSLLFCASIMCNLGHAQFANLVSTPTAAGPYESIQVFSCNNNDRIWIDRDGMDFRIRRFLPDGTLLWCNAYQLDTTYALNPPQIWQLSNGTLILSAFLYTPDGQPRVAVFAIDETGNILWSKLLHDVLDQAYLNSYHVIDSEDNIYVSIGSYTAMTIVKLSSSGNLEWVRRIVGDYGSFTGKNPAFRMIFSGTDVYVLAKDDSYPQMVKIDESGDVIFSRTYNTDDYRHIYGAKMATDGYIYITGMAAGSNFSGSWYNGAYLSKLDQAGNLIWSKYLHNQFAMSLTMLDLDIDQQGVIWLSGELDNKPILLSMDETGVLQSKFRSQVTDIMTYDSKVHCNSDGSLYWGVGEAQGFTYMYHTDMPNLMCQSTSQFNIQTFNDLPMTTGQIIQNYQSFVSTINLSNITISTYPATDVREIVCQTADVNTEVASQKEIHVFPNPVENHLNIVNIPENTNIVKIMDATGKVVMQFSPFGLESNVIDVSELKGLYCLIFESDHKSIVKRFVVK